MKILGIESSCDETAAAVIEDGTKILSNVVASSLEMHSKTGGIIPEIAAREQIKCIIPVIQESLQQLVISDIDAIAVTVGPGLVGSLLVGIETAKTLAYLWNKPIVPVNHMVGHLYANWLISEYSENSDDSEPRVRYISSMNCYQKIRKSEPPSIPSFPSIALVVSGGHTDLVLMKNHGDIQYLGGTRDDAAGECFDKSARLLGLPYPGGPAISAAAQQFNPSTSLRASNSHMKLPRPMMNDDNFDFSFSGLKTAVLREVNILKNNQPFDSSQGKQFNPSKNLRVNNLTTRLDSEIDPRRIQQLAFELQEAITDVLVFKTIRAAEKYNVKSILLAGGVSANSRLREKFSSHPLITNYQLLIPAPRLCTDNAAYIASCAFFNYKPIPWQKINVNPGLTISDKI